MDKRISEMRTIAADIVLNVLLLQQAKNKDGRIFLELKKHLDRRITELSQHLKELDNDTGTSIPD